MCKSYILKNKTSQGLHIFRQYITHNVSKYYISMEAALPMLHNGHHISIVIMQN